MKNKKEEEPTKGMTRANYSLGPNRVQELVPSAEDTQEELKEEVINGGGSDATSKRSSREEEMMVVAAAERRLYVAEVVVEENGRERLKRHRMEMAGRVWIPERWGQENMLKDWIDSSVFDRPIVPKGLMSAREALVAECRRTNSGSCRRQIKNPC